MRAAMDECGRPYFAAETPEESDQLQELGMTPVKIQPEPWQGEHRPLPLLLTLLALAGLLAFSGPAQAGDIWVYWPEGTEILAVTDNPDRLPTRFRADAVQIELGPLNEYKRHTPSCQDPRCAQPSSLSSSKQ